MKEKVRSFLSYILICTIGMSEGSHIFVSSTSAFTVPTVDAQIRILQDGTNLVHTTSWNGNGNGTTDSGETNAGTDSSLTNGVVRASDLVTYRVNMNLNGGATTNARSTITLINGTWVSIPSACLTS